MVFLNYIPTLVTSDYCTYIINNDDNLVCFGSNYCSKLGFDETHSSIFPPKIIPKLNNIKMICAGKFFTVCLDYNGCVYAFGDNRSEQLGLGSTPLKISTPQKINLPYIDYISCGREFVTCLSSEGLVYSFGNNNRNQLGLGDTEKYIYPKLVKCLKDVEFIQCGGCFSICKTIYNEVYVWGENKSGQLGIGNYKNYTKPTECKIYPENIISIKCGNDFTLLLTSEGQVYSFGNNSDGQLGLNDKNIKKINIPTLIEDIPEIQRIECGANHSMCIDMENNLWLFGNNAYGKLGLGDTKARFKPIKLTSITNIMDISSGGFHTCIKTIDNDIYAMGYNDYSQLGITSNKHQLTPIQVLKDKNDIWRFSKINSTQKSARK